MSTLDINAIRDYLLKAGCKVEYPLLVHAFKKHLYNPDPNIQAMVRNQFKDYVNRLVTSSLENNKKFIILRPEFREPDATKEESSSSVIQQDQSGEMNENHHSPPYSTTTGDEPEKKLDQRIGTTPKNSPPAVISRQSLLKQSQHQEPAPPPVPMHYRQSSLDDTYRPIPHSKQYGLQSSMQSLTSYSPLNVHANQEDPSHRQFSYQDVNQQPLSHRQHQPHVTTPRPAVYNRGQPPTPMRTSNTSLSSTEPSHDVRDGPFKVPPPPPPAYTDPKFEEPSSVVLRHNQLLQRPESLDLSSAQQTPPPRPPPRRRQSTASLFKQVPRPIEKCTEIQDLAQRSPGRVRQHALKLSSSASSSDLKALLPIRSNTMKENRLSRDLLSGSHGALSYRSSSQSLSRSRSSHREDESDSSSLQPLDPLRRRWAIEACSCNYNGLLALLKEDPKLASYKDMVNRYTALHWAAKFGNLDIIKLIAGTHGVSVNCKSSAGHTPLHVAYIFNQIDVADLLIKSYNANSNARDYAGKRPMQYLQKTIH